jgi:hypothetical protein
MFAEACKRGHRPEESKFMNKEVYIRQYHRIRGQARSAGSHEPLPHLAYLERNMWHSIGKKSSLKYPNLMIKESVFNRREYLI